MSNLTGRQISLLAACALALITTIAGIYGLVRGPAPTSEPSDASPTAGVVTAPTTVANPSLGEQALPHTTDPVSYARKVAVSLFNWDTTSGRLPTDYTATVLADADPSGEETPGLIDDVATYLPTVQQWLGLGAMEVVQTLDIGDAFIPEAWAAAVDQAHGQLRPGTTAVTIIGTRNRSGIWNGEAAESSNPVSFTVFVACPPAFTRCHLLRLSQLDKPLR